MLLDCQVVDDKALFVNSLTFIAYTESIMADIKLGFISLKLPLVDLLFRSALEL